MSKTERAKDILIDVICKFIIAGGVLFILVCIVGILVGVIYEPAIAYTNEQCNEHGWTRGDVSWRFDKFCFRTVDATEMVAPLNWVKSHCNELGECQE